MDVSAEKMIFGVAGINPQRRDELIKARLMVFWSQDISLLCGEADWNAFVNMKLKGKVLDIDLSWRMHKVSDGQRREVQICMGLLKPFKVLLLDEITVDLDVLARADLLKFLRKECESGATIIYATHIFDGLEQWPSHIVYITDGKLRLAVAMAKVKEISNLSLRRTVESWLRKERDEERKKKKTERKASGLPEFVKQVEGSRVAGDPACSAVGAMNNGWAAGRLHSTSAGEEIFLGSKRVLRQ